MKRTTQIFNILTLLLAILVSYYFNSRQEGATMKEISDKYANLLTPAGYAFSIWGLIYFSLILFSVYQLSDLFTKKINTDFVEKIGGWFVIANTANVCWVLTFTNDLVGLSVLLMCLIFISLLKIVINLNMEKWDAPFSIIALIWWPISLYFGWIILAMISNISAYLTSKGWSGSPLTPTVWATVILVISSFIFITMIWKRNMREVATVGIWGIIAIGIKNLEVNVIIAYVSFAVALLIFINTAIHAYKNRALGPIRKWRPLNN